MKLTTAIFVLSGLCSTVTSSPILAERAACTIKLQDVNNWVEAALLRYRHLPSIVGTPATSDAGDVHKMLQQNWKKGLDAFGACGAITSNVQIFQSAEYNNAWVIDESEAQGGAGDAAIKCIRSNFMRQWKSVSGCDFAPGSLGTDSNP